MLHLGSAVRIAFAASWIAVQSALVLTADERSDRIFGFRMFPEASTMQIHLVRELGGAEVSAAKGEWVARDAAGQPHSWSWNDRVRDPVIGRVDARVFASYGLATQLARLQRALDDVADHIPDDVETERLVARVDASYNGREPSAFVLRSHRRPVP